MRGSGLSMQRRRALVAGARDAARLGGELLLRREGKVRAIERKGVGDFVTDVDRAAEELVRRHLLGRWPDHGFLGEELPPVAPDAAFLWVVDPIDGTSNFARGLQPYACSVACLHRGHPVAAAAWVQPGGRLYTAGAGLGARLGRRRLAMTGGRLDDSGLLACQWHRGTLRLPFLAALQRTGTRIRNLGCTVAQLCAVADGRLDGNVQVQGRLWDLAAAAAIVIEAGGHCTLWNGRPLFPVARPTASVHYPTVAARARVHRQLLPLLPDRGPYRVR